MLKHISKRKFGSFTKTTALGLALLASFSVNAAAESYKVSLNKTQILHLPAPAAAIVIGNPDIADISIHSADTVFIIGRGYGETNILALDSNGQTILNSNIIVTAGNTANGVRIVNIGKGQKSYHCAPSCLPSPILGDEVEFINMYSSNAAPIVNSTSTGANSNTFAQSAQVAPQPAFAASAPPNAQFSGPPSRQAPTSRRPASGVEE